MGGGGGWGGVQGTNHTIVNPCPKSSFCSSQAQEAVSRNTGTLKAVPYQIMSFLFCFPVKYN